MSSVTVDELVMRIEIELDKFRSEAGQAESIEKKLRAAIKGTGEASDEAGKKVDGMAGKVADSNKELSKQLQSIMSVTKKVVSFLGVMAGSNAIVKFTTAISNANDQLGFMSKRLGMAARDIKGMDTAVAGLGGAGASAENTMRSLNQGIQEMVLMGNDSLIPFFSALGVGVVDASGNVRKMNDVLLDMSDSLSKMDPQQAYAIASAMGLDDGMANALIQGRDAMQEMLSMQEKAYVSSKEDIAASRELSKAQAFLSAQWEGLKTMLANALIPVLLKITKVVSGWMDYLARNERTARNFFEGIAIAVTVLLIPALVKAGIAILALVAPILGTAVVVAILAAGFALLYDDYKTWSEGGKSLFDWEKFDSYIKGTSVSVDSLAKGFARLLTGYDSLDEAQRAFSKWLHEKGIIDENGVSVRGLANAFKQLGKDIFDSVPAMKTMLDLIGAVMEGRWSDAFDLAKKIPGQMAGTLLDVGQAASGHVVGAIDTMLGHDPEQEGTISSAQRGAFDWMKNKLAGWVGSPAEASGANYSGQSGLMPPAELMPVFESASKKHGVPVESLIALAHQESRFNPNAVGPETKWGTAKGMMQYLDSTSKSLGINPYDPAQAIDAAAMQLRQRLDAGDTMEDAFKHHHAGPNRNIWGSKTEAYGSDVLGKMSAITAQRMTQGGVSPSSNSSSSGGGVQVSVGSVTVQTSATSLPEATAAGVAAGVSRSSQLINQLGGGTL